MHVDQRKAKGNNLFEITEQQQRQQYSLVFCYGPGKTKDVKSACIVSVNAVQMHKNIGHVHLPCCTDDICNNKQSVNVLSIRKNTISILLAMYAFN